jgi:hypothetical protein
MRQQPEKEDLAREFASGLKKSRSDTFQFERNLPFLAVWRFGFSATCVFSIALNIPAPPPSLF